MTLNQEHTCGCCQIISLLVIDMYIYIAAKSVVTMFPLHRDHAGHRPLTLVPATVGRAFVIYCEGLGKDKIIYSSGMTRKL